MLPTGLARANPLSLLATRWLSLEEAAVIRGSERFRAETTSDFSCVNQGWLVSVKNRATVGWL